MVLQEWEEWYPIQLLDKSEPGPAQKQVPLNQRVLDAEEFYGRWVILFGMAQTKHLVSFASWQEGIVAFSHSPEFWLMKCC